MTARDRNVLLVVGVLAVLGGFWFAVLAPKRSEARELTAQIQVEGDRLRAASQAAATASAARERYASDYATVAKLGKAVPVNDDVPSLVYQLDTIADRHDIDFRAIKLEGATGSSAATAPPAAQAAAVGEAEKGKNDTAPPAPAAGTPAATQAAAAGLPPGASVGPAGFPTMPFSFTFEGSFFKMHAFLRALDRLTTADGERVKVRGRLLTINGISLTASRKGFPEVQAQVAAAAYLLPAEQGLTGGATPAAPAAAPASSGPAPTPTPTAAIAGGTR